MALLKTPWIWGHFSWGRGWKNWVLSFWYSSPLRRFLTLCCCHLWLLCPDLSSLDLWLLSWGNTEFSPSCPQPCPWVGLGSPVLPSYRQRELFPPPCCFRKSSCPASAEPGTLWRVLGRPCPLWSPCPLSGAPGSPYWTPGRRASRRGSRMRRACARAYSEPHFRSPPRAASASSSSDSPALCKVKDVSLNSCSEKSQNRSRGHTPTKKITPEENVTRNPKFRPHEFTRP